MPASTPPIPPASLVPANPGDAAKFLNGANPPAFVTPTGSGTVNSGTAHQTAVYSGAGTAVSGAGPGTTGQVLTSNGSGADPTFQAPAAGALVLLESHTASASAELDFTTRNASGQSGATIQSDFDEYEIHFVNIVPASTNVSLQMQMSTDGGSTYLAATNYNYGLLYSGITDIPTQASGSGVAAIDLAHSVSTSANWSANGKLSLFNPGGAIFKLVSGSLVTPVGSALLYQWNVSGICLVTTAITGFRFSFPSVNMASGVIRVYGVAK